MTFQIRAEEPRDNSAISGLIRRAFAPMPFADGNEQDLPGKFRAAGVLCLSLVAESNGKVSGHVALTPATHESGAARWFGLGPLAVEPDLQRKGIGTALIAEAKAWLVARGAAGCILMGDTSYYPRHGFMPTPQHAPLNEPAEYFMIHEIAGRTPHGRFGFHPLFYS